MPKGVVKSIKNQNPNDPNHLIQNNPLNYNPIMPNNMYYGPAPNYMINPPNYMPPIMP